MIQVPIRRAINAVLRDGLLRLLMGSGALRALSAGFVMLGSILVARWLGPDGFGAFSWAFALIMALSVPTQLGFPQLIVREAARAAASAQWQDLRGLVRRATQACLVASLILLACMIGGTYASGLDVEDRGRALLVGSLFLPIMALVGIRSPLLRGVGHVVTGQLPELIIRPAAFAIATALAMYLALPRSATAAMGLHTAAAAASLVAGMFLVRRQLPAQYRMAPPRFNDARWFRQALPLALQLACQVITAQVSVLWLGVVHTDADVGLYRAAMQLAMVTAMPLGVVVVSLQAQFANLHYAGDRAATQQLLTRATRLLLLATAAPAALILAYAEPSCRILFGAEYAAAAAPLRILIAGHIVTAGIGLAPFLLAMTGHERDLAWTSAAMLGVNVLACGLLVPPFGQQGAALATITATILADVVYFIVARQRLGVSSSILSRTPDA